MAIRFNVFFIKILIIIFFISCSENESLQKIEINLEKNDSVLKSCCENLNKMNFVNNSGKIDLKSIDSVNLNVSHQKMCYPKLNICPCLLAGNGGDCIFYLTSIKRRYTPREYLNLQGFSPDFKQCVSNSKMYKQVGNSMSVNVLCFIYKSILESIS